MQIDKDSLSITFFTDPLLLSYITQFLNIKECLLLGVLSKKMRFLMQDHFRSIILQNNLHLIPAKTPIHQMHFYFDRCLRIFKYTKQSEQKEEAKQIHSKRQIEKKKKKLQEEEHQPSIHAAKELFKTTVQYPFKFKVVTHFQVGPVFTCCLDNKAKAFIFKTHHLINQAQTKEKAFYIQQTVKDIKCKAQKLVVVKESGQVLMYEANKFSKEMQFAKTLINWSIHIPVKCAYSSYSYTLFELQHSNFSRNYYFKHLFNYNIDLSQAQDEENNNFIYAIALNMHNNAYYLVKIMANKLVSVAVGSKEIFIVNQKHQTLVIQFENINQGVKQLTSKEYQPFLNKKIMKVYSGYNFFFALERNVEYIEEWTIEQVAIWLRKVGFADFSKIARAEKLDGKKLKSIERKYMQNVLGLTKLNMQQKLILCIQQVVEGKNEYDQLWVWGKNQCGQLGIISANYIAQPQRIKMDFLQNNDRIDRVFCGWNQSFIRTHRGKIYCSLMASERKKKKVVQQKEKDEIVFSDDQDFRREGKEGEDGYHFKNKRRKRTQDYRQENKKSKGHHKKYEEEQRWLQSSYGKAFFVSSYKEYVFIVQCPVQHKFQPTKQKKLRTSKAIIDKIIWSDSLDKSQFKIGIIDKEMGTIEVTPLQIQTFDYKETSVRYVKKNNLIVWDRQSKIDHL